MIDALIIAAARAAVGAVAQPTVRGRGREVFVQGAVAVVVDGVAGGVVGHGQVEVRDAVVDLLAGDAGQRTRSMACADAA